MNKKIDHLTGSDYESEFKIYVHYHNLTNEQATLIMAATTYLERDKLFNKFIGASKI